MKFLLACEESQAVTIELRKLGHEAYSCDLEPCSGGHPEWHLQQDVIPLLNEYWDGIIACGLSEPVVSLADLLDPVPAIALVKEEIVSTFQEVFQE